MIEFEDCAGWKWVGARDVVEFTADRDGHTIVCRVSRKCLEDHCGDPKTAGEYLDAAKKHSVAIEYRVQALIQRARFELNGSITLRSNDW